MKIIERLLILALWAGLSSCAAKKEAVIQTPDTSVWELVYITGLAMDISGVYPEDRPTIAFNNESMVLTGNTGCNDFIIPYESSGNSIRFSARGKQTTKACPGPGEPHFKQQLKAVDSFSVSDRGLFFYGKKVPLMHFKAL